jgi:hypothetical protein
MTKSELIAKLAARYPQLVAKDAELAVKMILDAMARACRKGSASRSAASAVSDSTTDRPEWGVTQVRRAVQVPGQVCAAFQGRQGIARARGHQEITDDRHRSFRRHGFGHAAFLWVMRRDILGGPCNF